MNSEGLPPKSPWSNGEKFEKALGPDEVARIREGGGEDGDKEKRDLKQEGRLELKYVLPGSDTFFSKIHGEALEKFRHVLLRMKGDSFTKRYRLKPDGSLETHEEDRSTPDLLACVQSPSGQITQAENKTVIRIQFTPEHLREAARELTEKFPDLSFEFGENSTRTEIFYTVKIRKDKK